MSLPSVAGRVALITGGGTGIGRAIGLELARRGVHLVLNYSRSAAEAQAAAQEARDLGVLATPIRADVSSDAEVRALVARAVAEHRRLDFLVCSAGVTRYIPLGDLAAVAEDDWDRILGVNVKGIFFSARAAAPHLRQSRGAILAVASNSGLAPSGSSLPYIVSKAMVVMLTKCLAAGLAPDVRVNAIAPGFVETRWLDRTFPPEIKTRLVDESPTPPAALTDVASAALLLLANESMTGQTLVVDNGEVMH